MRGKVMGSGEKVGLPLPPSPWESANGNGESWEWGMGRPIPHSPFPMTFGVGRQRGGSRPHRPALPMGIGKREWRIVGMGNDVAGGGGGEKKRSGAVWGG